MKGRLQRDDFVVDDGAEGYVDNGMDDWAGGNDDEVEESEDEADRRKGTCILLHRDLPLTSFQQRNPNPKQQL